MQAFNEELALHRPQSESEWSKTFLSTVKVIYAFRLLDGTDTNDGWTPLHSAYHGLWNISGGIFQSAGEGFSKRSRI